MSRSAKNYQKNNPDAKRAHSEKMKEYYSDPNNKAAQKAALNEYWSNPNAREKKSEQVREYYRLHPEKRDEQSKRMSEFFLENPDEAEKRTQAARKYSNTEDANKKRSQALKKYYEDEDNRESKRQEQLEFHRMHPERAALLSDAWHSNEDIISIMQQIAYEEFPNIGRILNKMKSEPLTEAEEAYRKAYLARCHELYPGMEKIVGEIYAKMLEEYKIKNSKDTQNSSSDSILQSGYLNKNNINFTGGRKTLSLIEQAERLNLDNLPPFISNSIKKALSSNKNVTLYDIHTKIFTPLLECKTLDEAKALYPEFRSVIDAKDLNPEKMSPTMLKIKNGEIEGITLENLSLELLKIHYGKGISPNSRSAYYGLSKDASLKLFDILKIKKLDGMYLRLLNDCNPIKRKRVSESWTSEKRAQHAAIANKIWDDPKKRQAQSEQRQEWFKEHPDECKKISERLTGTKLSSETKRKISESKILFYENNPEFSKLRSESFKQHKEIVNMMKQIAKEEFPYLRIIFLKRAEGMQLEDYETEYLKRYHKRCEILCPNHQKIIGETFSTMWQEFKAKKSKKY